MVAFDHGMSLPLAPGQGNPGDVLPAVCASGADGLLVNPGLARQAAPYLTSRDCPRLVVRCDWTPLAPAMKRDLGEAHRMQLSPEGALKLGASAACLFLIGGPEKGRQFYNNVADIAAFIERAHAVGLPVIVEATLWGSRNEDQKDPDGITQMCRIAAELGADAIKTEWVEGHMHRIIDAVGGIPVLTLGGAPGDFQDVLNAAQCALDEGASGLIFGRNVWQAPDVTAAIGQLRALTSRPSGAGL